MGNDEYIKGGIEIKPYFPEPLFPVETLMEQVIKQNAADRKKRLMRLEKEMLVDMVFNLESRNEFLVHNLSEVEKMYNKLKEEEE